MTNPSHPFEYTDRYGDANAPRPDPDTMCKGQCEGIGYYPEYTDGALTFVRCPDCHGTGKRSGAAG